MNTRILLLFAGSIALTALPSVFAETDVQLKQMDRDGDGRISRSEYTAAADARFNKLDTNGDGVIAPAELYSIPDPLKSGQMRPGARAEAGGAPGSPAGKLGQADRNGDGQISRAENQADAEAHFDAMDIDKDGAVSANELEAGSTATP